MKAHEILQKAIDTIGQRGQQNGYDTKEERSAAAVARLWNWHTDKHMSEEEAWRFLICLKEVRLKNQIANGSDFSDTLVDLVSYQALLAECLTER